LADQIVITEKASQAKDVRAAVSTRFGETAFTEIFARRPFGKLRFSAKD
jgi:hypothetical protein